MNKNINHLFSKLVLSILFTESKQKELTYYIRYDIEPELDANSVESNLHKKMENCMPDSMLDFIQAVTKMKLMNYCKQAPINKLPQQPTKRQPNYKLENEAKRRCVDVNGHQVHQVVSKTDGAVSPLIGSDLVPSGNASVITAANDESNNFLDAWTNIDNDDEIYNIRLSWRQA